jgi:hypothetical protein
VPLGSVDQVSQKTVWIILETYELKPWRKEQGCIPRHPPTPNLSLRWRTCEGLTPSPTTPAFLRGVRMRGANTCWPTRSSAAPHAAREA